MRVCIIRSGGRRGLAGEGGSGGLVAAGAGASDAAGLWAPSLCESKEGIPARATRGTRLNRCEDFAGPEAEDQGLVGVAVWIGLGCFDG